jgi:hypothetical protein
MRWLGILPPAKWDETLKKHHQTWRCNHQQRGLTIRKETKQQKYRDIHAAMHDMGETV